MSKTLTFTEQDFELLNLIVDEDYFGEMCGRILSAHFEGEAGALEDDGSTERSIARYVYGRMVNRDNKDDGSI